MSPTTNQPHTSFSAQVLILLGAYLFGGGGGADSLPLTERVQEVVQDDGRRAIAGDYARQIQDLLATTSDDSLQLRGKILAGMRQYPRDTVAIRADLATALRGTFDTQERIVNLRFKLLEQMTRDEWTRLINELEAQQ